MVRLLGHRQTKGAATDKPNLTPPHYISTLPRLCENVPNFDDNGTADHICKAFAVVKTLGPTLVSSRSKC